MLRPEPLKRFRSAGEAANAVKGAQKIRAAVEGFVSPDRAFPDIALVERLKRLPRVTQLTNISGATVEEKVSAIRALAETQRVILVLPEGASPEERSVIEEAQALADVRNADLPVTVYSGKKLERFQTREKALMRSITERFLASDEAQKGFRSYMQEVIRKPELLEDEYQRFTLPRLPGTFGDSHYFLNLGIATLADDLEKAREKRNPFLRRQQDIWGKGNIDYDRLRTETSMYVQRALNEIPEVSETLTSIVQKVEQEQMNSNYIHSEVSDGTKANHLLLGFLSNYLRGGVYYGFRPDQDMSYLPRAIALKMILEARNRVLESFGSRRGRINSQAA